MVQYFSLLGPEMTLQILMLVIQGLVLRSSYLPLTILHCKNNLKNSIGFFLKHKFCSCKFQLLLEIMAQVKYWFRNVIQSSLCQKVLKARSSYIPKFKTKYIRVKYGSWVRWPLSVPGDWPVSKPLEGGGGAGGCLVEEAQL